MDIPNLEGDQWGGGCLRAFFPPGQKGSVIYIEYRYTIYIDRGKNQKQRRQMTAKEVQKQAQASRIPFGRFKGQSVLDAAKTNPGHLKFLLAHKYALNYHPWLRRLIIRTLASLGQSWK